MAKNNIDLSVVLHDTSDYKDWLVELKERFYSHRLKASCATNGYLLDFYWKLGRDIEAKQYANTYGSGFYKNLSQDLKNEMPGVKGFSPIKCKTMKQNIIDRINHLANEKEPFLFVVNYAGSEAYIRKLSEIAIDECLYDFEGITNVKRQSLSSVTKHPTWKVFEPNFEDYTKSFETVKSNILRGNSYLANLTCKVAVDCNLTLEDIFLRAKGKYKILLIENNSNRQFVCFSPETFVKIKNGMIYSYPMKGTIDASLPEAEQVLMGDKKEAAEHATIVDLIRNDLSRVAEHVRVDKYRYIDVLHTNKGNILQTSSEISGKLPTGYQKHIGNILDAMLPAGSITGAPKDKTMEIIHEAEGYDRGFYTGVMGIYNNGELNSAVMIRFLENDGIETYFKAGGGITSKSDCRKEYEEVLQKVYLPSE